MAITQLIDKLDVVEIVRDRIAAILTDESTSQQELALEADPPKDPDDWKLSVYVERSNPWSEFLETPDSATPIVNVSVENGSFDKAASNTVESQKATYTYNIDCYGYGVSADDDDGHVAGDESAARESQRAARLVRNILMAGTYAWLGLRGVVWERWISGINFFQPSIDGQQVQHVVGARVSFEVSFLEFSPQVEGRTLELVNVMLKRHADDVVLLNASWDVGDEVGAGTP